MSNRPNQKFYRGRGRGRGRGRHRNNHFNLNQPVARFQPYGHQKKISVFNGGNITKAEKKSLTEVLRKSYNHANNFLDLQDLGTKLNGIKIRNCLFVEMCKIIKNEFQKLESLDISKNNLNTFVGLRTLGLSAPKLCNLSLSHNKISSFNELDHFKDIRHRLKQIMFEFNPVMEKLDPIIYHYRIVKRFPEIKMLDCKLVKPIISFRVVQPTMSQSSVLTNTSNCFWENDNSKTIGTFLQNYFNAYDSADREGLLKFYSKSACFSLTIPKFAKKNLVENYMNSRNLLTLDVALSSSPFTAGSSKAKKKSQHNLLHRTPLKIVFALSQLPETKHDLTNILTDTFILPSLTSGGPEVLNVTCKGIFVETETNTSRIFHRSFLLVPPLLILNDQLYISNVQPTKDIPCPQNAPPQNSLQQSPEGMIQALCQQASVSPAIAIQALTFSSGNFEQALQAIRNHVRT